MTAKSALKREISTLKQTRDELALQIHLGAVEAKEEFNKAQARLDKMVADFEPLKDAVEQSAGDVFTSLQLVGEEILNSFTRIRKSLQ